jgi:hypothetical protein
MDIVDRRNKFLSGLYRIFNLFLSHVDAIHTLIVEDKNEHKLHTPE